jgi:anti-anti-sigma regulatory factor
VVLDVSEIEFLDANALIELRLMAQRLDAQGRALVVAGVTPQRFIKLRDAGVLETVTAANVYSDLDLAAAHAMSLLDRQERGD